MAEFSNYGGVGIMGFISPMDTLDTYAVIDPLYGIDGIRNVSDEIELNEISYERRRAGMLVGIEGGTRYFKLKDVVWDFTMSDWDEIFFYTISQQALVANEIVSGSLNYSNQTLTLQTNSGGTITITGLTDTYITGGTYDQVSQTLELTDNYGGSIEITGFSSNVSVSANTGLGIEDMSLFTTYNTLLDGDITMGVTIGGLSAGTEVSQVSGKTFVTVFDELLFPTLQPTYTIPTITLSNNSQILEVGTIYSESLTSTGKKNDAGDFVYLEILRNGIVLDSTSEPDKTSTTNIPSQYGYADTNNPNYEFTFTYNESYLIPSGVTVSTTNYRTSGNYLSGFPKSTNKGVLDTRPAEIRSIDAPQLGDNSFNSATKTITGIFPYYYGYSITEPTLQDVIDAISGGTATKVLASAAGNLTINYNVTTKFLWFAHLASYGQKTQWFVSSDNKGLMSPSSLFDQGVSSIVDSESGYWSNASFNIYLGNYATTINSITLGNNLF